MVEPARLRPGVSLPPVKRPGSARATASGFVGAMVTFTALLIGAVLAIVFAATLVFVLVLATALMALASVAWRAQRQPLPRRRVGASGRGGHAWVTYDWDRGAP